MQDLCLNFAHDTDFALLRNYIIVCIAKGICFFSPTIVACFLYHSWWVDYFFNRDRIFVCTVSIKESSNELLLSVWSFYLSGVFILNGEFSITFCRGSRFPLLFNHFSVCNASWQPKVTNRDCINFSWILSFFFFKLQIPECFNEIINNK